MLETAILQYVALGYRLIWRDSQAAQLVKPKRLDAWLSVPFGLLGPLFGLLVYFAFAPLGLLIIGAAQFIFALCVLEYLNQRDATLFLYLTEDTIKSIAR